MFPSLSRRAYTLLELVIVVTLAGILASITLPRVRLLLDRQSVHSATSEIASVLASARLLALRGHAAVAVEVDSATGMLCVRRGGDTILLRNVATAHGIRLGHTRDSLTYDAYGLGRGAANLSIIVQRGAAVETVFVSRFGRVR